MLSRVAVSPGMIMRSRKLAIASGFLFTVATIATVAAVSAPRPAYAQNPSGGAKDPYPNACTSASTENSERAHKLYEFGKAYYDEGNYEQAIIQFREAYKRDCSKHDLLIIISRAYELKGDRAEAIRALELYVDRVPAASGEHRTRIENLKIQLAKANAAAASASSAGPAKPVENREHTVPPWIVVGIGGAVIISGIVVIATSPSLPANCNSDTNTCEKIDPDGAGPKPLETSESASFKNRSETAGQAKDQPKYGAILIGAGVAIVAGGLLWHFLEPTGPVETTGKIKPKLTPQAAPGYAGLSLGGTF
jgi:tetratricopeptide (TPR) repeat protein